MISLILDLDLTRHEETQKVSGFSYLVPTMIGHPWRWLSYSEGISQFLVSNFKFRVPFQPRTRIL